MNEKENIIKALKNYNGDKIKAENIRERIEAIDPRFSAEGFDTTDKKTELESQLKLLEAKIGIIERCLDGLTNDEKQVLKTLYIDREYRAADKIAMRLSISRTNVYYVRNRALDKMKQMLS